MSKLSDGLRKAKLLKQFPRSFELEHSKAFTGCTLTREQYDMMLPEARAKYIDHYIDTVQPTFNGRKLRKTCRECMARAVWSDGYISDLE